MVVKRTKVESKRVEIIIITMVTRKRTPKAKMVVAS